jgi:integrase
MSLEPIAPERAVELYLQDRESELSKRSQYGHKSRLGYFTRWCDEQDITNMNKLSGRDLHRFRLWRRADGDLAPISEKTQMDTLRVFIRWCTSIEAVPADLHAKVVSPSMSEEDETKDVMVDADVAEGILDYLSSYEYASARHLCFQLMWRALLRRGGVRTLDVSDYDPQEMSLEVQHRPETGTPIKNKQSGERFIALNDETCALLDDWLADQRPDVEDEYGRKPLLGSSEGRLHVTTIQNYIYSVTTPCMVTDECPHDRVISECDAAGVRTGASKCPSSRSPHAVRRGAITNWLSADIPEPVVSARANVSSDTLHKHYDRRTERKKMEQRRKYLDKI